MSWKKMKIIILKYEFTFIYLSHKLIYILSDIICEQIRKYTVHNIYIYIIWVKHLATKLNGLKPLRN
jgi:hypothetical protein